MAVGIGEGPVLGCGAGTGGRRGQRGGGGLVTERSERGKYREGRRQKVEGGTREGREKVVLGSQGPNSKRPLHPSAVFDFKQENKILLNLAQSPSF